MTVNKEDDIIFVNKAYWAEFSKKELDDFAVRIFNYYRSNGFPYFLTDVEYRDAEYHKLVNYNYKKVIKDNVIQQTMHGLGLAWSFFPHAFNVRCTNKMSPLEAFNDDEIFMKIIKKRLQMGTYISDSGILKMIRLYTGVQGVSNFRPTAAAAIYDRYAPKGIVWDMSGGWGGRMLGAMISGVDTYYCSEPAIETYKGLCNMRDKFLYYNNTKVVMFCSGSEDLTPPEGILDLCFTSPPYFDLEKYSDESTQSYIKFPDKNLWVEGFLRKTFQNCYLGLKSGGYMAINIADPKKKKDISLESETIRVAEETGFKLVETLKLALSNPVMVIKKNAFKYEPVFVFQK